MALPLESTRAGVWILRCCAGVALLLLTLTMPSGGSLAEDQGASYSATVKVDATADSAASARACPHRWSAASPRAGGRSAVGLVR